MKGQERAGTPSVKGQENKKGAVKGQMFGGATTECLALACSATTRSRAWRERGVSRSPTLCVRKKRSLHRGVAIPKERC